MAGTLQAKRAAVKGSILWHMHKGTQWAIVKALELIGVEAEYINWYESGGRPYTFSIKAKVTGDYYRTMGRDRIIASIRRAVNESKAARSFMADLDTSIEFTEQSNVYAGLVDALMGWRVIGLARPKGPGLTGIYAGLAGALQGEETIRIAHEGDISSRVYAGLVTDLNISMDIGVDLDTMQELLMRFEERIFTRLDAQERRLTEALAAQDEMIAANFEEVKDMLRWKPADEPLNLEGSV